MVSLEAVVKSEIHICKKIIMLAYMVRDFPSYPSLFPIVAVVVHVEIEADVVLEAVPDFYYYLDYSKPEAAAAVVVVYVWC
jgi:hypothetical protein